MGKARRPDDDGARRGSAILHATARIVTDVLTQRGLELAEPVRAQFRAQTGNTGVQINVKLRDPAHARAARTAIVERFGGECGLDVISVS